MRKKTIPLLVGIFSLIFVFTSLYLSFNTNTDSNTTVDKMEEDATTEITEGTNGQVISPDEETTTTNGDVTDVKESYTVSTEYVVQSLVSLNVREEPDTTAEIVGIVSINETLDYIENESGWYKILYNGSIAYVSANSKYSILKSTSDTTATQIENVIAIGMSLLGTPYEYGSIRVIDYNYNEISAFTGDTFDCSAFVQYSFYIGAGVPLYGDSRSMSTQGTTVDFDDLERGDVIFMTSTSRQYNTGIERIGHVAIYLGDNQILHTYGTGGVRVTEFSTFWQGRYIKSKRMI